MDLHRCCSAGDVKALRRLLENGINIDIRDDMTGSCPLHIASSHGYLEIVHVLLQHGTNVNRRNRDGSTPLHVSRHLEIVRALITHGASVDDRDNNGSTLLHYASGTNQIEIIRELILNGAMVNIQNNVGFTPLHCASSGGHLDVVRELIKYADVSIKNCYKRTALDVAMNEHVRACIYDHLYPDLKEPDSSIY
jgi:ankyrin repeat protein